MQLLWMITFSIFPWEYLCSVNAVIQLNEEGYMYPIYNKNEHFKLLKPERYPFYDVLIVSDAA